MPNIPIYTSKISSRVGAPDTQASGDAFGAGVGRALQGLGGDIIEGGQQLDAALRQRRAMNADNKSALWDYSPAWNDQYTNAEPGGAGLYEKVSSDYDERANKFVEDINDPKERQLVLNDIMGKKARWMEKTANAQMGLLNDKGTLDTNTALDAIQNKVRNDPTQFDEALADGEKVVGNWSGANVDAKAKNTKAFTANLSYSYFQALISRAENGNDFSAIRKELGDEKWIGRMSPEQYEKTLDGLTTAENKLNTEQRAAVTSTLSDFTARNNGKVLIPQDELKSAYAMVTEYGTPQQNREFAAILTQQDTYATKRGLPASQLRQEIASNTNWQTNQTGATKFLLSRLNKGHPATYITMMQPALQTRLAALINAAPPGMREYITIVSGRRDQSTQDRLYAASGGNGMVAKRSQHTLGAAADLGWKGGGLRSAPPEVTAWLQANAGKYGLKFPLLRMRNGKSEPWHIELMETRGGPKFSGGGPGAATSGMVYNAPANLRPTFERYGVQYGVSPNLLAAMGMQESGFRTGVTSPKGATGIMQLMPGTAKDLGVDPRNPQASIAGAAKYMGSLLKKYNDVDTALAAYNWGPGNVDDWLKAGGDPSKLPRETRDYIEKVHGYAGDALERSSQVGVDAQTFYKNQALDNLIKEQTDAFSANGDMMTYEYKYNNTDMASIDSSDGMAERGKQAMSITAKYGIPNDQATPLTQSEVEARAAIIKGDNDQAKLDLMSQLQGLGPDMAKAAYRQLGEKDPVWGAAASIYETSPATAADIVRGQTRIDADKDFLANRGLTDKTIAEQNAKYIGSSLSDLKPTEATAFEKAIAAMYAQNAATRGKYDFDEKAYAEAVKAVLGNVDEVHGELTVLPQGISGSVMENAIGNMTKDDWVDMSVAKLPPRYGNGDEVPAEDMATMRLSAIDEGEHYLLRTAEGKTLTTGVVLKDRNGNLVPQPYVFAPDPNKISSLADGSGHLTSIPGGVEGATMEGAATAAQPTKAPEYLPQTLGELDAFIKIDPGSVDYNNDAAPDAAPAYLRLTWPKLTKEQRQILFESDRQSAMEYRANNFDVISSPAFGR